MSSISAIEPGQLLKLVEIATGLSDELASIDQILSTVQGKRYERLLPKDPNKGAELRRVQALYDQKIEEILLSGAQLISWKDSIVAKVQESGNLVEAVQIFNDVNKLNDTFKKAYKQIGPIEAQLLDLVDQNTMIVIP